MEEFFSTLFSTLIGALLGAWYAYKLSNDQSLERAVADHLDILIATYYQIHAQFVVIAKAEEIYNEVVQEERIRRGRYGIVDVILDLPSVDSTRLSLAIHRDDISVVPDLTYCLLTNNNALNGISKRNRLVTAMQDAVVGESTSIVLSQTLHQQILSIDSNIPTSLKNSLQSLRSVSAKLQTAIFQRHAVLLPNIDQI